jgi:hypothetical protein
MMNTPSVGPSITNTLSSMWPLMTTLLSNTSTYPPVPSDIFSDPPIDPSLPLSPPISSGVPDYDSIPQTRRIDNICFFSRISSVRKQRKQLLRATEALKLAWFCKSPPTNPPGPTILHATLSGPSTHLPSIVLNKENQVTMQMVRKQS